MGRSRGQLQFLVLHFAALWQEAAVPCHTEGNNASGTKEPEHV